MDILRNIRAGKLKVQTFFNTFFVFAEGFRVSAIFPFVSVKQSQYSELVINKRVSSGWAWPYDPLCIKLMEIATGPKRKMELFVFTRSYIDRECAGTAQ